MTTPPRNREELVEAIATYLDVAPINVKMLLSALESAGVRLVPAEATEEMVRTGASVLDHPSVFMEGPSKQSQRKIEDAYMSVLSASPYAR